MIIWDILPVALMDLSEIESAGVMNVDRLIDYNLDVVNFAGAYVQHIILEGICNVMSKLQGGSAWTGQLRDAGGSRTASQLAELVRSTLTALGDTDVIKRELNECVRAHQIAILKTDKSYSTMSAAVLMNIVNTTTTASVRFAANRERAVEKAIETLAAAAVAVSQCPSLPKLGVTIDKLRIKERFGLDEAPPAFPAGGDIFAFLGHDDTGRTFNASVTLRAQWDEHCRTYVLRGKDDPLMAPVDLVGFWLSRRQAAPELSTLALGHLARPVSSACVERVFSYLTHMDTPYRRSMGAVNLKNILYVRGNWRSVRAIMAEFANKHREAEHVRPALERHRAALQAHDAILQARSDTRARAHAAAHMHADAGDGGHDGGDGDAVDDFDEAPTGGVDEEDDDE